eukprot:TRINITY_DN6661_c0_g1_i2.p2 TRINITY_DN6661_c0_g1~~TRINITY_DN6661_c0_g1_i2.p2  ORF type:complete len:273 (+),score=64.58 TRINITY_DN6661_c0_g1_i2:105-923(+)
MGSAPTFGQLVVRARQEERAAAAPNAWARGAKAGSSTCGRGADRQEEDDDDIELQRRCRLEAPPGPAGNLRALRDGAAPGAAAAQAAAAKGPPLHESLAWLAALRALGLPFSALNLGLLPPVQPGAAADGGLALVARLARREPGRRWRLLVQVRTLELLAGELEATVRDPTGELGATLDRRLPLTQPKAASEGAVLLLEGVVAVSLAGNAGSGTSARRGTGDTCRLLVMPRAVARVFSPNDVTGADASALLADARAAAFAESAQIAAVSAGA